ncbi:conserved hypothetical protein [Ricinus communis]|uniref:Uncharacterized protein n=1 Tax=Ricinus communis TaxID=3988 RepID=B9T7Q9_RICCO|nr:conserved hypothetical protein [Ricinus communis]
MKPTKNSKSRPKKSSTSANGGDSTSEPTTLKNRHSTSVRNKSVNTIKSPSTTTTSQCFAPPGFTRIEIKSRMLKERRQANQGFSIRIFSGTGHIYSRMPRESRAKFVSGASTIAVVGRNGNT